MLMLTVFEFSCILYCIIMVILVYILRLDNRTQNSHMFRNLAIYTFVLAATIEGYSWLYSTPESRTITTYKFETIQKSESGYIQFITRKCVRSTATFNPGIYNLLSHPEWKETFVPVNKCSINEE